LRIFIQPTIHPLEELISRLRISGIAVVAGAGIGDELVIVVEDSDLAAALDLLKRIGVVADAERERKVS
jgi:hypothetical protein